MDLRPALAELSLARTRAELGPAVARLGQEGSGAAWCEWYFHHPDSGGLRQDPDDPGTEVGEDTLPGRCAASLEAVEDPGSAGGRRTVALPGLVHGELVGVLVAGAPADDAPLAALAPLAAAATRWVGLAEDWQTCARHLADLAGPAQDLLEGREGHVDAVARLALELGRGLGLSAPERNRLWQAGRLHDLGRLLDPGEGHAAAGADFLRRTRALAPLAPLVEGHHRRQPAEAPLGAWILALAEDAAESRGSDGRPHGEWVEGFLRSRLDRHHPLALEALGRLEDEGRLQALLEGPAR